MVRLLNYYQHIVFNLICEKLLNDYRKMRERVLKDYCYGPNRFIEDVCRGSERGQLY
jgi:hypothetical protein